MWPGIVTLEIIVIVCVYLGGIVGVIAAIIAALLGAGKWSFAVIPVVSVALFVGLLVGCVLMVLRDRLIAFTKIRTIYYADHATHWSKQRILGRWPIRGRFYFLFNKHHTEIKKDG